MTRDSPRSVVVIDGICVLCSRLYRFVSSRDHDGRFRFVTVQEPEGRALCQHHGIDPDNPATFILVEGDSGYVRSDAALRIVASLPGWGWTRLLRIIPRPLRDWAYDVVARNRYQWFGKNDVCLMPNTPKNA
jgi:predicted DCC family thiol-disulfide oxidoreductase YuxK